MNCRRDGFSGHGAGGIFVLVKTLNEQGNRAAVAPAGDPETVSFRRRSDLDGVEVRSVCNSSRAWQYYTTDFEFHAPSSWHGEIWHRRRQTTIQPGSVLCAHPGEVLVVRRVVVPGSGSSIAIDAQLLEAWVSELCQSRRQFQLRPFAHMSERLRRRLSYVFNLFQPGPSTLEVQSALLEFVETMVAELVDESAVRPTRSESDWHAAERVRECLQQDTSAAMDLSTLAVRTGLSRFQALRIFKRRYGLPPHMYQLRVRLGLAQKALRDGLQPAQVAAKYGFVDQSHLTRHFKRLIGVTPAQYVRARIRVSEPLCA